MTCHCGKMYDVRTNCVSGSVIKKAKTNNITSNHRIKLGHFLKQLRHCPSTGSLSQEWRCSCKQLMLQQLRLGQLAWLPLKPPDSRESRSSLPQSGTIIDLTPSRSVLLRGSNCRNRAYVIQQISPHHWLTLVIGGRGLCKVHSIMHTTYCAWKLGILVTYVYQSIVIYVI